MIGDNSRIRNCHVIDSNRSSSTRDWENMPVSNELQCEKIGLPGFLTRYDTKGSVQSQKQVRRMKFQI